MFTWTEFDGGRTERLKLLTDMAYLSLGLVPPSHYPYEVTGSLEAALSTLTPDERRKACRKYRKLARKVRPQGWKKQSFYGKQALVKLRIRKSLNDSQDNDE